MSDNQQQSSGQGDSQGTQGAEQSTAESLWGDLTGTPTQEEGQQSTEGGEGQQSEGQQSDDQSEGRQTTTTEPAAGNRIELTQDMLAQLAKSIGESARGPVQQQAPPQMTQEEFDKTFNIFRPTKEQLAALRGEDEEVAVKTLEAMLHGAARQSLTLSSHLMASKVKELQEALAPALQLVQERELEKAKTEFFEKNPDLKGYDQLLVLIRDHLVSKGTVFKTKEEAFKAVAEEARKQLALIPGLKNGSQVGGSAQQQGQNAGKPVRKMPTTSGAKGQSGAGDSASSGGQAKNTAERLFG